VSPDGAKGDAGEAEKPGSEKKAFGRRQAAKHGGRLADVKLKTRVEPMVGKLFKKKFGSGWKTRLTGPI
jgi:hypothetical protein